MCDTINRPFLISFCLLFCSCGIDSSLTVPYSIEELNDTTLASIREAPLMLEYEEGLLCTKEQTIRVLKDNQCVALVKLGKPMVVAQAEKAESWGYFQFPKIFRAENGHLVIYWQMRADSYTAYGEDSYGFKMSKDEGETWENLDREYFRRDGEFLQLRNGQIMQVTDVPAKNIHLYEKFPSPVNDAPINNYNFYKETELPDDLRGFYLDLWDSDSNTIKTIHATLEDPGYLRYAVNDNMPIVWWGNMKEFSDGSLVSGVYPCFYQGEDGKVQKEAVTFYKSNDKGFTWVKQGTIPCYRTDNMLSYPFDGTGEGFTEPSFEILKDGTFLCVMRTGYNSPMYKSYSKDNGVTWSIPEPFTPNGVKPSLSLLQNGVLVLASGRPGMQIRFCINGDGSTWTEPLEMLPVLDESGKYDIWAIGCGYPSIIHKDDHTFYITYSDFRTTNENGDYRKSIIFRKIEVIKVN